MATTPFIICVHCTLPVNGYARVAAGPVCRPAHGLDCWALVTDHRHQTPCREFACEASARMRRQRYLGMEVE